MPDFPAKTPKWLPHNNLRHFRESGTVPAEADAPVVCPEPAKPQYGELTTVTPIHKTKRFLVLALLASLTLGPGLLGGNIFTAHAKGKDSGRSKDQTPNKVASNLSDMLAHRNNSGLVKVILQLSSKPSGQLNALLSANGVKIRRHFNNLNSFALELPGNVVDALSNFPEVAFISLDSEVISMGGHVARTTGYRQRTLDER